MQGFPTAVQRTYPPDKAEKQAREVDHFRQSAVFSQAGVTLSAWKQGIGNIVLFADIESDALSLLSPLLGAAAWEIGCSAYRRRPLDGIKQVDEGAGS